MADERHEDASNAVCGCDYELVEDGAVQRKRWFHDPDCPLGPGDPVAKPDAEAGAEASAARSYFNPLRRNGSLAGRIRWLLLPWIAYAWRYRDDFDDAPNPGRWWHHCFGSACYWLDEGLGRLPSGALFPPLPPIECDCDYCRGVPGAVFEP